MELKLTEQEIVRREKAENLREMGIDPFGSRFDRTHNTRTFKEEFSGDMNDLGTALKNFVVKD